MKNIGEHIIHFDQLSSTNAYALELLSKSKPAEGTVISTDNQFAGRGQMQNKWESEAEKNVCLSVILYPRFLDIREQFYLNRAVSLAVLDTIAAYVPDEVVKVKWPNDIYIGDKKVAGILIQNQVQGTEISSAVVGIGINVNQRRFYSDAPNPCSLIQFLGCETDLTKLKLSLYINLTTQYQALQLKPYGVLDKKYSAALYKKNTPACFVVGNKRTNGIIKGVTQEGLLLVQMEEVIQKFNFKEIQFCPSIL